MMKFSLAFECPDDEKPIVAGILRDIAALLYPPPCAIAPQEAPHEPKDAPKLPEVQMPKEPVKSPVVATTSNHSHSSIGWEPRIRMALGKLGKATAREICKEAMGAYDPKDTRTIAQYLTLMRGRKIVRTAGNAPRDAYYWELVA